MMKIGVMSDLHLGSKPLLLERALSRLQGVDALLLVGDCANSAEEGQYALLRDTIRAHVGDIPVYCVSGNHDNPARNDAHYRHFEADINAEYLSIRDESGAFYKSMSPEVDLQ